MFKTRYFLAILSLMILVGCTGSPAQPAATPEPTLAEAITVTFWVEGMPLAIFDAFTEEYGVTVNYQPYEVYDDVLFEMEAGTVYDVVIVDVGLIKRATEAALLAEIDYANIPNHINVSPSFRNLSLDPENKYSIPFDWGTTALFVRSDLFAGSLDSWDALWQGEPGTIGLWDDPGTLRGAALKSLGYSANSQNEDELNEAFAKIDELQDKVVFLEQFDPWTSAYELESGNIIITYGWSYDGLLGQELSPDIEYIIPEEGTLLWLESMAIPHNAAEKYTAEVFMNFMLRPEIAGQFVNESYYAVANELIEPYVDPEILANPVVYPSTEQMVDAEFLLPLPPDLQELSDQHWAQFEDAVNQAN